MRTALIRLLDTCAPDRADLMDRLRLLAAVALGAVLFEQATRAIVVTQMASGSYTQLVGFVALARSDHYIEVAPVLTILQLLLGVPALVYLTAVSGYLPDLRRTLSVGGGLLVGGGLANHLSANLTGYVANWIAIGSERAAIVVVPADIAQVVGLAIIIGVLGAHLIGAWLWSEPLIASPRSVDASQA